MTSRFFDSSALVKLYLEEPETPEVVAFFEEGWPLVSTFTWAEVLATLSRALKNRALTLDEFNQLRQKFQDDFQRMVEIPFDDHVLFWADQGAEKVQLRGGDLTQLASALTLRLPERSQLDFITYDKDLWRAAQAQGFTALPADLLTR